MMPSDPEAPILRNMYSPLTYQLARGLLQTMGLLCVISCNRGSKGPKNHSNPAKTISRTRAYFSCTYFHFITYVWFIQGSNSHA